MKIHVTVKLSNSRKCFVDLSHSVFKQLNCRLSTPSQDSSEMLKGCLPLVIQLPDGSSFISSWSGNYINDETSFLSLDRQIAKVLALQDGSQVQVLLLAEQIHPAISIDICALNQHDWEMLELNSKSIEKTLLDQISVIKSGSIFPFYFSVSGVIFLKVVSTNPSMYVYLQEFTEVHVLHNAPVSSRENPLTEVSPGFLNERVRKDIIDPTKKEDNSLFSKMATSLNHVLQTDHKKSKTTGGTASAKTYRKHVSMIVPVQSIPGMSTRLDCRNEQLTTSTSTDFSDEKMKNNQRSEDIVELENLASQKSVTRGAIPPYLGMLCESCLPNCKACLDSSMYLNAEIAPMRKVNESKKINKSDQASQDMDDTIKIVIHVKLIPARIWNHLYKNQHVLLVNPCLLEQLQLDSGAKIELNCFHKEIKIPQGIVLHCESNVQKEILEETFLKRMRTYIEATSSVIMNQGTLLTFQFEDVLANVVIELIGIDNDVCGRLDSGTLDDIFIAVEEDEDKERDTDDNLSKVTPVLRSRQITTIVNELQTLFNLQDDKRDRSSSILPAPHVVLVHGKSIATSAGCGKTLFAEAIAYHFRSSPYFYNIETICCVELRGKKVETIREFWYSVYERLCEPGLLIIDDLDELILNVDPIQDGLMMSQHVERLVDEFQSFLEFTVNEGGDLHIIVTSASKDSLHRFLLPESNCHVFSKYVCLSGMSENKVETLKESIVNLNNGASLDESKIEVLKKQLDGYSVKDINSIARKTWNTKRIQFDRSDDSILSCEELEKTLKTFKSSLLHGVDLHKPKTVSWSDIGGLQSVKKTLIETLIWPALYPELLSKCPMRLSAGVLLYGVPGTAKTMLASAVAYESHLNFISIKGPELLSKYVGSSETNVRDLFARAQAAKPCIVFFDELDSFAPRRGHDNTGVTDRVVNQLLTQLDGVESLEGVFVLAATSRPDLIDPALLRPGRFDKSIKCEMPNESEREEILRILAQNVKVEKRVDIKLLASLTEDFSGADLKALLYNAQVESAHTVLRSIEEDNKKQIDTEEGLSVCMDDIKKALDVTQPSVTMEERIRFEAIFEEFGSPRQRKSSNRDQPMQRVTFA